jgi:hypothetical protein
LQPYLTKVKHSGRVRKLYFILLVALVTCVGCQWHFQSNDEKADPDDVVIERFDRAERLFLTTGDFSALQQMKTAYPIETRVLIEDVLQLGRVDESDINTRFLYFFQDSTLQALMHDVEDQYHNVNDLNKALTESFGRLTQMIPSLSVPRVYTQIGSLDQSVVVGDSMVGISLDKYLGKDHPVYLKYGYNERQRSMMTRQYIVPDCLAFYLLGHYPMTTEVLDSLPLRDAHMSRIQYVVNRAVGREVFISSGVKHVADSMARHSGITVEQLLQMPVI